MEPSQLVGGVRHGRSRPVLDPIRPEVTVGLLIDCDTCAVRDLACHDCVVTVLLGPPPESGFDEEATRALDVLAASGVVPPLRMVSGVSAPDVASA